MASSAGASQGGPQPGNNANKQRIERLQNRLLNLHSNVEATKTNKSAQATAMVSTLRERFNKQ